MGYSYGVQPDVDHFRTARCLTIAGTDIYHPTQDKLTGAEIAFGGDMTRSLKGDNYLVLETEAQGFPGWTPYKGQLRLQAYSHIASGANSVMYWHWHSIHNSFETYWKGLLSHDFQENETYREACIVGNEWKEIGDHLVNLKKKNDVAVLVSNEALTALKWFGIEAVSGDNGKIMYNDVVRWIYDTLYKMNVECDFLFPESENMADYKMIVVPALYAAPDELLKRLDRYVREGGTLVTTFKTGFANENVKVSHEVQPHILRACMGYRYDQFTFPVYTGLQGEIAAKDGSDEAKVFMELLIPEGAQVLASYDHYNWNRYAAVTRNHCEKGYAYHIGCMTDESFLKKVFLRALGDAGITRETECEFPLVVRKSVNDLGKTVRFYLNYSGQEQAEVPVCGGGKDLLSGEQVKADEKITIPAWGLRIVEEES